MHFQIIQWIYQFFINGSSSAKFGNIWSSDYNSLIYWYNAFTFNRRYLSVSSSFFFPLLRSQTTEASYWHTDVLIHSFMIINNSNIHKVCWVFFHIQNEEHRIFLSLWNNMGRNNNFLQGDKVGGQAFVCNKVIISISTPYNSMGYSTLTQTHTHTCSPLHSSGCLVKNWNIDVVETWS